MKLRLDSTIHQAALAPLLVNREDADGDSIYLARDLEQISAETFDVLRHPKMGRTLVPFQNILTPGAGVFEYDMYDVTAQCKWLTNWATIVGGASANKVRVSIPTRYFGGHYQYTIQDLERAAMARGVNGSNRALDAELARANREAHEQFFDDLIADGDSERDIPGLPGLLEALGYTESAPGDNKPFVAPVIGTWGTGTTGPQKILDLERLCSTPEQNTKNTFVANRLIMPLSMKPLMKLPYATSTTDGRTVESVFLANQPANGVKSIDYWYKLDTKSTLSGPRAIAYFASDRTFKFVLAYDYKELAPQISGYGYTIPTMAQVAGLISVYPLAMAQMDLDS